MSVLTIPPRSRGTLDTPVIAVDLPVLYEDEGQEEMGDARPHVKTVSNLYYALLAHFSKKAGYEVLTDMNLYYHPVDRWAYVSPDVMVVQPPKPLPEELSSYRIGENGPVPTITIEVLSRRTLQQGDLTQKPEIYAELGVSEYLLADVTGVFLPERLLLKCLNTDKTWINFRDQGEGVESRKNGFGVRIESDGQVRVRDTSTGKQYLRPEEGEAKAESLEAENTLLRALLAEKNK